MAYELKTNASAASVDDFIDGVADESRRDDCRALVKMMQKATKAKPVLWGPSIVGFGTYEYRYPNGKSMQWMRIGFSPRKSDLTLYLFPGPQREAKLAALGKHKCGKGCVYIKRLADVDKKALTELIDASLVDLQAWIDGGQLRERGPS